MRGVAVAGRGTVAAARGEPPGAGRQDGVHRPGAAAAAGSPRAEGGAGVRASGATSTSAGGNGTATTGSSTTRTSSSSSSRSASPSRTRRSSVEDAVGWGLETDAETLVATSSHRGSRTRTSVRELLARIDCPVLVIHGSDDAVRPCGVRCAARGARERCARGPRGLGPLPARPRPGQGQPAAPRLRRAPRRAAARAGCAASPAASARSTSPRRSGSATRSATSAIADELRKLHPDLEIDWLAQHPVTAVLEARGERIHPASAWLANESRHIESESAEHDLHCFQAIRRMDEILLSNFMVFHDLVARGAVRPLDRRRGVGARLLPAREPGAEAGRLRLADRLRRLAADARRRRARGVPDRRLQRRDDRAHRALPARPRPGALRRQPRRHRPRARSGPTCR